MHVQGISQKMPTFAPLFARIINNLTIYAAKQLRVKQQKLKN